MLFYELICKSDDILLQLFRYGFGIDGDAYHEVDILTGGKFVQPGNESAQSLGRLVPNQLVKVINEEMGYVIVAGVDAADKPFQKLVTAYIVGAGIYEASLIGNVLGKLALFFYADHIAVAVAYSLTYHVYQLLSLSGPFQTHD